MTTHYFGSRFTVIEQIGRGNYGTLFRVIDGEATSLSERIIATKKLKDTINHPHVLREISVQRHAQQCTRHVAKLLHVVTRDQVRTALMLEYVPLDLRNFLNTFYCDRVMSAVPTWCATGNGNGAVRGPPATHIPLPYVRSMVRGLLEALQCLHARGVAHRDVKPENILVEPLGLDHPLRCVCPPEPSANTTKVSAAASPAFGDTNECEDAETKECCWVHARRPCESAKNNNYGAEDGVRDGQPSAASTARDDNTLESCRYFFENTVQLHHELTGDDLARAIHLLHCSGCRHAANVVAAREAETEEIQKVLQFDDSELLSGGEKAQTDSNAALREIRKEEEEEEEDKVKQAVFFKTDESGLATEEAGEEQGPSPLEVQDADDGTLNTAPPLSPDVKLCDFGSARYFGALRLRSASEQREELTPGPTTPVYCAPEMMLLQQYGTSVDIWAVGVILFEMLTGEFFLSVGTLRSIYGDLVVHDDYCVMHRLNMMFRHLGTPTAEEWRRIAHPSYYPDTMLPHLPQIPHASLFRCLPSTYRVRGAGSSAKDADDTDGEGASVTPESNFTSSRGAPPRAALTVEEEENHQRGKPAASIACLSSAENTNTTPADNEAVPDLSQFLFYHIGACGLDFLRSLLRYNPEDRLTAAEALQHPFLASSNSSNTDSAVDTN